MDIDIDVVVLSRADAPLRKDVLRGLARQRGVCLHVHHVVAAPRPSDSCRWEAIARGRNLGKALGSSPWVMFVDDDVVLARDCARQLLAELRHQPNFAGVAADYLGEGSRSELTGHVAMGATLFKRQALDRIRFRWETGKCECLCCCGDLRRLGYIVGYSAAACAVHRRREQTAKSAPCQAMLPQQAVEDKLALGRILVAFDRLHYHLFLRRFLGTLRASGNTEWVIAVCYGLYGWQRRVLERTWHVEPWPFPAGSLPPQRRRLLDFQQVLQPMEPTAPVAYWDAGDVLFQGSLQPLWRLVAEHPGKLLAVREPLRHPETPTVASWTMSIRDPAARRYAFDLLSQRPFLNAGFAAGGAGALLRYCRCAHRLRNSAAVEGTVNRGDQTVFNLYCHTRPDAWHEIDEGWNYCLNRRPRRQFSRTADGRFVSRQATPIPVIHGNARTLDPF